MTSPKTKLVTKTEKKNKSTKYMEITKRLLWNQVSSKAIPFLNGSRIYHPFNLTLVWNTKLLEKREPITYAPHTTYVLPAFPDSKSYLHL